MGKPRQAATDSSANQTAIGNRSQFLPQQPVINISSSSFASSTANTTTRLNNAPTSLTNLAQLSGISLVPIASTSQSSSSSSTAATTTAKQLASLNQRLKGPASSSHKPQTTAIPSSLTNLINNTPSLFSKQQIKVPASGQASNQQQNSGGSTSKKNAASAAAATTSQRRQPTLNIHHHQHNLNSIPSIQLLNHSSNISQADSTPWISTSASKFEDYVGTFQQQLSRSTKLASSRTTNTTTTNNRRPKLYSNLSSNNILPPSNNINSKPQRSTMRTNNNVQVIPVSDGLSMFDDGLSDLLPTNNSSLSYDDMSTQPSLEPMISDQCGSNDESSNNISLIKLMAILKNPALTITPVSSSPRSSGINRNTSRHMDSKDYGQASPMNFDDLQQWINTNSISGRNPSDIQEHAVITISDSNPDPATYAPYSKDSFIDTNMIQPQHTLDINIRPKTRLPQSAANLQLVHGGSVDMPSTSGSKRQNSTLNATKVRNSNNLNNNRNLSTTATNDIGQFDHHLNQLSNYDTAGTSDATTNQPTSAPYFNNSFETISFDDNTDVNNHQHDKDNHPIIVSTSVRNLMLQQLPSGNDNAASAQLLKHIAEQNDDNNRGNVSQIPVKQSMLEQECLINLSRSISQVLREPAKEVEICRTVISPRQPRRKSENLVKNFSRHKLFVPNQELRPDNTINGTLDESNFGLNDIAIEENGQKEWLVSDQHSMLESMMSDENKKITKSALPEPDEIFINRSKRVMSSIDTKIERKKRRRFERISGRENPKTDSIEEQCAESEEEWSGDENSEFSSFIVPQLPLTEIESDEKRNYMRGFGLVSRQNRNKLLIEQCEEKNKLFSPLVQDDLPKLSADVTRFIETIRETGGKDIQLRVDSNIKRNELPLIEGLSRASSRLKTAYMNMLGLEKRPKRSTLCKAKPIENTSASIPKPTADLKKINSYLTEMPRSMPMSEDRVKQSFQNNPSRLESRPVPAIQTPMTSCREAMKLPSKHEYMKSLGLMAS